MTMTDATLKPKLIAEEGPCRKLALAVPGCDDFHLTASYDSFVLYKNGDTLRFMPVLIISQIIKNESHFRVSFADVKPAAGYIE
jgi:hypothetical protein